MQIIRLVLAVYALVLVSACTSIGSAIEDHEPLARASVQIATLRIIDDSPERAYRVAEVTRLVLAVTDGDRATTVAELRETALSHINWDRLDAAEAVLVRALIEEIARRLSDEVERRELSADAVVRVQQVLGWVLETVETP